MPKTSRLRRKPAKTIIIPINSGIYRKAGGAPNLINVPPKAGRIAPAAIRILEPPCEA